MKKHFFSFQIAFWSIGLVSAQVISIDSSFGNFGKIDFKNELFYYANMNIAIDNQILLDDNYKYLLLDSNGIYSNLSPNINPDSLRLSKSSNFKYSGITSNNIAYNLYTLPMIRQDYPIRMGVLDLKLQNDSKFTILDTIGLGEYRDVVIAGFGIDYQKVYCALTINDIDSNSKFDFFEIEDNIILKKRTIINPFLNNCKDDANPYQDISNIISDENHNKYFGFFSRCDKGWLYHIVKIKPSLDLDSSFGNNGYLSLPINANSTINRYYLNRLIDDEENGFYIQILDRETKSLIFYHYFYNGNIDLQFATTGTLILPLIENSTKYVTPVIYEKSDKSLLLFLTDSLQKTSHLVGIDNLGRIIQALDKNGGIVLQGAAQKLLSRDHKCFYVLTKPNTFGNLEFSIYKLKKNGPLPVKTNTILKDNITYSVNGNWIQVFCGCSRLKFEGLYDIIGRNLEVATSNEQNGLTLKLNSHLVSGEIFFLKLKDINEAEHILRIIIP